MYIGQEFAFDQFHLFYFSHLELRNILVSDFNIPVHMHSENVLFSITLLLNLMANRLSQLTIHCFKLWTKISLMFYKSFLIPTDFVTTFSCEQFRANNIALPLFRVKLRQSSFRKYAIS